MKSKNIVVCLIIALGLLIRVWDFGSNPPGLYLDEASHGYNAYSLLKTGKDEYGKSWPIMFRSFGTYSSSLHDYLAIVPVALLGLKVTSIRLVSLIFGVILLILITFWLGRGTGLIVAVSPIFVFTSKAAFEPNLALALFILATILAIRSRLHPNFLLFSFFIYSLSAYAYHAERFLAVFSMIFFGCYYWKYFPKIRKILVISCLIALISLLPLLSVSMSEGANSRFTQLGYPGTFPEKIITFTRLSAAYISPKNLFSKPDPDLQRSFPDLSVFYWWMILPFFVGIYQIIKNFRTLSYSQITLIIMGLISIIPGAITKDYFSTLRVLPFFITVAWLVAGGFDRLNHKQLIYPLVVLLSLIDIYSGLILLKHERSVVWNYEYRQLSDFVANHPGFPIVVDNSRNKPVYILLAFYLKYPPVLMQVNNSENPPKNYYSRTEFSGNMTLGNVSVRPIFWSKDVYKKQLLVADKWAISPNQVTEHCLSLTESIRDINGEIILNIYKTDPEKKCMNSAINHETPDPACLTITSASIVL